jgi:hypothetical protein
MGDHVAMVALLVVMFPVPAPFRLACRPRWLVTASSVAVWVRSGDHLLAEIEICCPDPNFLELPASDPEVFFSPRARVLEVGGAYIPHTPAKNRFGLHVGSLRALFLLTFT